MAVHIYTQTIQRTTQKLVRAVPRLCGFYPGICLTTEEKARKTLSRKKNLSQVKKNLSQSTVYILPKHPHKHTHTHAHTRILLRRILFGEIWRARVQRYCELTAARGLDSTALQAGLCSHLALFSTAVSSFYKLSLQRGTKNSIFHMGERNSFTLWRNPIESLSPITNGCVLYWKGLIRSLPVQVIFPRKQPS